MRRQAIIAALLIVGVGVVLGATVFRADIAQATGLAQSVTVNNTAANPVPVNVTNAAVPVREQNLDGGKIRVHEEGTADVNVTNSSIAVSPPSPITSGGDFIGGGCPQTVNLSPPKTASALVIHMSSGVGLLDLDLDSSTPASFPGPAIGGTSDVVLALARPIKFNKIFCSSDTSGHYSVGWVGND